MTRDGSAVPRRAGWIFLGVVCALAVSLNVAYLALDRTPQHWDSANHLTLSMQFADRIAEDGIAELGRIWTTDYFFYPPGFHLANAPAFPLLRHSLNAGIVWQQVYLLATLVVLYFIVSRYYGPLSGALAAAAYASFPIVLGFSRMVFIENLLALEVALVVALAMPLRAFTRPLLAMALGFVVGYGQMTKWQFVLYVLPLLAIVWIRELRAAGAAAEPRRALRRVIVSALASAAVAFAVAGPWYLEHTAQVLKDMRFHAYEREMGDAPLLSARALVYYVHAFPWQMIGIPISIVLFGAIASGFRRRTAEPHRFVWCWVVVLAAFALTFSKHKEGRFLIPVLPIFTAILVGGIAVARPRIRAASVALLLVFGTLNAMAQTVNLGPSLASVMVPIGFGRQGFIVRQGSPEWILMPIRRQDWALGRFFSEIAIVSRREGIAWPRVHFCLPDDHHYYNPVTIRAHIAASRMREATSHDDADFCVDRVLRDDFERLRDRATGLEDVIQTLLPDGSVARLLRRAAAPEVALEPRGETGRADH